MKDTIKEIELLVLNEESKQFSIDDLKGNPDNDCLSVINNSTNGDLDAIFKIDLVRRLVCFSLNETNPEEMEGQIKEGILEYLHSTSSDEESDLRHLIILLIGVANLKIFLEQNWVGPPLNSTLIWPNDADMLKKSDDWLRPHLLTDGEVVTVIATNLVHLFIARIIFTQLEEELAAHCKTSRFWQMRCLWIQQFLYEERLPTLKNKIVQIIEEEGESNEFFATKNIKGLHNKESNIKGLHNKESFIQFHLEACHIKYFYYESVEAQKHMEKVKEVSGLEVNLTGVLGKRTRFQESSLPQLVLRVQRSDVTEGQTCNSVAKPEQRNKALPVNCQIEDEVVLENMILEDPEIVKLPNLTPLEQCFILGLCYHHRRNKEGQGSIIREETLAYIRCVLSQSKNYCVETMALFTRCKWEPEKVKYMGRSMTQLEELSNQCRKPSKHAINRLAWIFSSILPPRWTIEHELGDLYFSIGNNKGAVEVFERLQMWDEVIRCHAALSNNNKAEALIRQQLSTNETPLLWCYLGDVTRDEQCYHKAWQLSGQRFARAQRSLAFWHVGKREFEESLKYFERSLEINSLQLGVWFSYGCASLACGQYDKAANGFRRSVNLDGENFQAWTNLATAYIRGKNKPRAFIALQEALKCDYDNWRIWENYLAVSVDIGQFEETIRAYHKLLDIKQKEKYKDVEVVTILVKAVCENMKDAAGRYCLRLKGKLMELLGRITSMITDDADLWRLYARLTGHVNEGETLDESGHEKVLIRLQKSQSALNKEGYKNKWSNDPKECLSVCNGTVQLAEAYNSYLSLLTDEDKKVTTMSSAKLAIKNVLAVVKKNKIDFPAGETLDDLNKAIEELERWLETIFQFKS